MHLCEYRPTNRKKTRKALECELSSAVNVATHVCLGFGDSTV